ncbi:DNA-directed DNA polymerase [Entomophthora muscae]|uniref:DNA-directed DNA polymerase n=1 Tax=Entomophthora muscae TaxID=34485 RepID=A0ACC2U2U1_9FUNG|nr:DNA-directed DNA polymerase [Entomophthora muscae]
MKSEQSRNMMFGRLFGLLSISRSGILAQPHVTVEDWKELISCTFELRESKSYMQEPCSHLILSLISQVKDTKFEEELAIYLWESSIKSTIEYPDELSPLLALVSTFPALEAKAKEFELFKAANVSDLASILKRQRPNQSSGLPSAWIYLLDSYTTPEATSRFLGNGLSDFWKPVVDGSLFSKNSGVDRQHLGLLAIQHIVPRLSPDQLALVLTDNLCHCLLSILADEESPLYKTSAATLTQIAKAISKNPHAGLIFVSRLYNHRICSRKSKSLPESTQKVISSILTSLDEDALLKFIDYLMDVFNGNEALQGLSPSAAQLFAITQLSKVVKIVKSKGSEASYKRIIMFLAFHSMFKASKASIGKLHELRLSEHSVSQEAHQLCADKLLSVLAGALKMLPLSSDRKASKAHGLLANGDTWIKFTLGFIKSAEFSAQLIREPSQVDIGLKDHALKILAKLKPHFSSKVESLAQASKGIELLVQHLILEIYFGSEELAIALQDIETCFKHITSQTQLEDQPEPIDVLVDLLVSFLSRPSSLMREMATAVFGYLTGILKKSTIELLLEIFTSAGEEKNDLMEEDDEFEEIDSEDLAEISDHSEGEESEQDKESSEDESEDEEMDADPVDPVLLEKIKSALGPAGKNSDDDNLGDDEMMAFDEKLGEIFKVKKAIVNRKKEAKLSMAHLKLKIVEWIALFIQLQPNNDLVVSLCVPLLSFAKEYHGSTAEKALFTKILVILNKDIHRYNPAKADIDGLIDLLEFAHDVSRKAPIAEIQKACQSICKMALSNLTKSTSKKTNQAITTTYKASLMDHIGRKKSTVSKDLFNELIACSLSLSWSLVEDLLAAINLLEPGARPIRPLELLLKIFENSIKQKFNPNKLLVDTLKALQEKARELLTKLLESSELLKAIKNECLRDFFKLVNLSYRFEYASQVKQINILAPSLEMAKQLLESPRVASNQSIKTAISLAISSSQSKTDSTPGTKREAETPSCKAKKPKSKE